LTTFKFEIIYRKKIMFEFLKFDIQNFQMTSVKETAKTTVAVLKDIYNSTAEFFYLNTTRVPNTHFKSEYEEINMFYI